jgi:hypothetical protein
MVRPARMARMARMARPARPARPAKPAGVRTALPGEPQRVGRVVRKLDSPHGAALSAA